MSQEIAYEEAKNYEGFLDKKSKKLIATWQTRYFRILEGKIIVYSEKKEDSIIKGQINIELINIPEPIDKTEFKFVLKGREFILRAKDEQERDNWVKVLTLLKSKMPEEGETKKSISLNENIGISLKKNKIESVGKVTAEILKKHGFEVNKEEKLSKDLLIAKGIDQLINISDPKIQTRIYHDFIFKKHKTYDYFQKRWFFIFSERPLFDNNYIKDDVDLDKKKLKEWLKYDTLFYFKYEANDENSKSAGELELKNSHKIELLDKDDKYYLNLDIQDRKFELYCESKSERDIWFEVLKNSRRTTKEYEVSITKQPRNIELLYNIFLMGEKEFNKKLESEKTSIVGNFHENVDIDIFEFNQNSLGNLIVSTLDGCNSNSPPKLDLLKAYASYMNKQYLEIVETFWNKGYNEINLNDILKISSLLFNMGEKLNLMKVDDPNFYKNSKILIKIYMKKTYSNLLAIIENILKDEREKKAITDNTYKYYYSQGPQDLFELLSRTFDLIKEYQNKYFYESILKLYSSCTYQYLLGVETTLTNADYILDREFLLAMANNSMILIKLLNKLMEDIKIMKVLDEKEIKQSFKLEKTFILINFISQKAIIDLSKILVKTNEIFGQYREYMNELVLKKSWNEILKLTLYYMKQIFPTLRFYIRSLNFFIY